MPDDKIGELQMYQGGEKLQYSGSQNCFGGKILISGDTKIFLIPASSDEDEKFIVSDISFFNHTSSYFISLFFALAQRYVSASPALMLESESIISFFAQDKIKISPSQPKSFN